MGKKRKKSPYVREPTSPSPDEMLTPDLPPDRPPGGEELDMSEDSADSNGEEEIQEVEGDAAPVEGTTFEVRPEPVKPREGPNRPPFPMRMGTDKEIGEGGGIRQEPVNLDEDRPATGPDLDEDDRRETANIDRGVDSEATIPSGPSPSGVEFTRLDMAQPPPSDFPPQGAGAGEGQGGGGNDELVDAIRELNSTLMSNTAVVNSMSSSMNSLMDVIGDLLELEH
jgi:hypothetical protein